MLTEAIGEYDGATLVHRYVPGAGVDQSVAWYERNGGGYDRRWLIADERGSVIAVAGAASGGSAQLLNINTYDEYGRPGSSNAGRFGYTGQAWLPEVGLYHYRARAYDPGTGRFLQTDPVGYEDDNNLYQYAFNDPLNMADPTGQRVECTPRDDGSQECHIIADSILEGILGAIEMAGRYIGTQIGIGPSQNNGDTGDDDDSEAGRGGDAGGRNLRRDDNSRGPDGPVPPPIPPVTEHGQQRRDEAAAGDAHRQVGDPNRVVHEGRPFRDTETGNTVYVNGDRVVVVNQQGQQVTQWSGQTRANTQSRIRSGRWEPR